MLLFNQAFATEQEKPRLQNVTDNVYAIVGSLANRSTENLGNNATFGFVVTSVGVVLIDSGGTYKGAEQIHEIIKGVTDQPVVKVINTGGQDHRWFGNEYFRNLGAEIIASKAAVEDQKARLQDQLQRLGSLVGDEVLQGTRAVYADKVFDNELKFRLGETEFELRHAGQAHTPGDVFIWLPEQDVMFTGDIVYIERMLGIGEQSTSKSWAEVYETMMAFDPLHIVPGHGHVTSQKRANKDTYGYLTFLRKAVSEFMEGGGDISEIRQIDQSQYNYLLNHETLAGRNAQKVYSELEWE
jgi:glyoxylase-like metal-dependent hydrolase (beta-lactamase superfamily II)